MRVRAALQRLIVAIKSAGYEMIERTTGRATKTAQTKRRAEAKEGIRRRRNEGVFGKQHTVDPAYDRRCLFHNSFSERREQGREEGSEQVSGTDPSTCIEFQLLASTYLEWKWKNRKLVIIKNHHQVQRFFSFSVAFIYYWGHVCMAPIHTPPLREDGCLLLLQCQNCRRKNTADARLTVKVTDRLQIYFYFYFCDIEWGWVSPLEHSLRGWEAVAAISLIANLAEAGTKVGRRGREDSSLSCIFIKLLKKLSFFRSSYLIKEETTITPPYTWAPLAP